MARQQYDALDVKIMRELSRNARKPFLEIARQTNVSGAAIHQRVHRLLDQGVIRGFDTNVNPQSIGYDTCAFMGFFLNDGARFEEVVEHLRAIPEVTECYYTTGRYDIFVKLHARNNDHLLELIHGKLMPLGLARTETLISFKEVFHRPLPINPRQTAPGEEG